MEPCWERVVREGAAGNNTTAPHGWQAIAYLRWVATTMPKTNAKARTAVAAILGTELPRQGPARAQEHFVVYQAYTS